MLNALCMRYALRITGEPIARNKRQRMMYYLSNISPIYQMVSNHLNMSNALIYSELDRMGGVILNSQNTTAHIAPI